MALAVPFGLRLTAASAEGADCPTDSLRGDVAASVVVQCSSAGGVEASGIFVVGAVDLGRRSIDGPFVCTFCVFSDNVSFRDAAFGGRVDLRGSIFDGGDAEFPALDASGASFDHITVFSTAEAPSSVGGGAVFATTTFRRSARFSRMVFSDRADFSSAAFAQTADFRQAVFQSSFDLTRATIGGDLDLEGTRFNGDLLAPGARIGGSLDGGAVFAGELRLSDVDVSGRFSVEGARFVPPAGSGPSSNDGCQCADAFCGQVVDLRNLEVGEFFVDFADLAKVCGPAIRIRLLELLEANAKSRGDLETANDARYARLSAQSSNFADWFFYQLVAGYLVRWAHPVASLGVFLLLGAMVRTVLRRRRRKATAPRHRVDLRDDLWASTRRTWSNFWRPYSLNRKRSPAEWLEAAVDWTVLSVALLALSNSLPVARDLLRSFL